MTAEATPAATAPVRERARILLVDDSMLMRKAASKMLGEEFDVVTAVDGDDAWDKIQTDRAIQVVFTDLSMPRMDGYALLRCVRESEDEGTLNMPVIVVTGAENDESARMQALQMGATDFITKPFSSVDLLARARAHANYRRLAKKLEQQITHDALTGLANRAGFLDRLQQDVAFCNRHGQPLTIVRIDIDGFRDLFLKQGKARAEAVIAQVAHELRERVRQEDTAARIGLAGFALALPGGQHDGSRGLIERLRAQFASTPVVVDGRGVSITVTAAVSTPLLGDAPDPAALLDACDARLQLAVRAGGNRVFGDAEARAATPMDAAAEPATPAKPVRVAAAPATAPAAAKPSAVAAVPAPTAKPVAAAKAEPVAAPTTASAAATPGADSIDHALAEVERGMVATVTTRLPALLKRLLPLFRLLNRRQREQLVDFLQKL
jgi:two-component system cell cycle response regulator